MKSKNESLLDYLYISAPCSISWDSMEGDSTVRNCGSCNKSVYNISDMTTAEAQAFLSEFGDSACMQFYRRPDGTIMTDNCPRVFRKMRDRYKKISRVVASFVALLSSMPFALAQSEPLRGKPVLHEQTNPPKQVHSSQSPQSIIRPHPAGLAGGVSYVPPNKVPTKNTTPAVDTVINRLPGGKTITEVQPTKSGNVIDLKNQPENKNVERSAQGFYEQAEKYRKANNFAMAEFYFEKAIAAFDKQKRGDQAFRKHLQRSLDDLRSSEAVKPGKSRACKIPRSVRELSGDELLPERNKPQSDKLPPAPPSED